MLTWKRGTGFAKADAQKCFDEICTICDLTPKAVVDKARDESTELHKCFEWDDHVAAEQYRLVQAREILRFLVEIKESDKKGEPQEIRVYFKMPDETVYKPTEIIIQHKDEYKRLLAQALRELSWFRNKYEILHELEPVFKDIDKLVTAS